MDVRELQQANVAYLAMVRGFLTGPFAQREPAKAEAWLQAMSPPLGQLREFERLQQKAKNWDEAVDGPDPAEKALIPSQEKALIRSLDKMLSWALARHQAARVARIREAAPDDERGPEPIRPLRPVRGTREANGRGRREGRRSCHEGGLVMDFMTALLSGVIVGMAAQSYWQAKVLRGRPTRRK